MFVALPIASSGVDVDFATQVATLRRPNSLTAIRPVLPYLRDSGGAAERTTGPIGNIYPTLL